MLMLVGFDWWRGLEKSAMLDFGWTVIGRERGDVTRGR